MQYKYNILHFSDLHFGEKNIQIYEEYIHEFPNFFTDFQEYIEKRIKNLKNILVVVLSGDLGSKGKIIVDEYLKEFLKLFHKAEIPVITCLGNHDLIRENIDEGKQFKDYCDKIKRPEMKQFLGIDPQYSEKNYEYFLSDNFEKNQASYIYFKNSQILFLSFNSCKSIREKPTNEKKRFRLFHKGFKKKFDQDQLDVGALMLKDLKDLKKEIINTIPDIDFVKIPKFLLAHHRLINTKYEDNSILNFLNVHNIRVILSGHEHRFKAERKGLNNINNFVAGSPFVIPEERTEKFNTASLQFNRYEVNIEDKWITPFMNILNDNKKWIENRKYFEGKSFENINFIKLQTHFEIINGSYDLHEKYIPIKKAAGIPLKWKKKELTEISTLALRDILTGSEFDFLKWKRRIRERLIKQGMIKNINTIIMKSSSDDFELWETIINDSVIYGKEEIEKRLCGLNVR